MIGLVITIIAVTVVGTVLLKLDPKVTIERVTETKQVSHPVETVNEVPEQPEEVSLPSPKAVKMLTPSQRVILIAWGKVEEGTYRQAKDALRYLRTNKVKTDLAYVSSMDEMVCYFTIEALIAMLRPVISTERERLSPYSLLHDRSILNREYFFDKAHDEVKKHSDNYIVRKYLTAHFKDQEEQVVGEGSELQSRLVQLNRSKHDVMRLIEKVKVDEELNYLVFDLQAAYDNYETAIKEVESTVAKAKAYFETVRDNIADLEKHEKKLDVLKQVNEHIALSDSVLESTRELISNTVLAISEMGNNLNAAVQETLNITKAEDIAKLTHSVPVSKIEEFV